jgi:hypothetical protein
MADSVFSNRVHRNGPLFEWDAQLDDPLPHDDIGVCLCVRVYVLCVLSFIALLITHQSFDTEVPYNTLHVDDMDEAFAAAERKPDWGDLALGDFMTVRQIKTLMIVTYVFCTNPLNNIARPHLHGDLFNVNKPLAPSAPAVPHPHNLQVQRHANKNTRVNRRDGHAIFKIQTITPIDNCYNNVVCFRCSCCFNS